MSRERLTTPGRLVIGSRETATPTITLTNALTGGLVPSSPVVTLVKTSDGLSYPAGLNGSATLSASAPYTLSQPVHNLQPGETYELRWLYSLNTSPASVREDVTLLVCDS